MFRILRQHQLFSFAKKQSRKMSIMEKALNVNKTSDLDDDIKIGSKRLLDDKNVDESEKKIIKLDVNNDELIKNCENIKESNVQLDNETPVEKIRRRNFAIMLGYLGKDYFGMQRNPKMRTIEEDLISALYKAKLIDEDAFETIQYTNFQRAARTDKGVSATRQVCSAKLPENASKEEINQFLPKEIRVFGLKRVTKGFNSKNQCNARTYSYTLPTYAFASDDPNIIDIKPTDEDIEKRMKQISTIDGKPFNEFRITPEIMDKLNETLKAYEGTHNFHNFTSRIRPFDPQAMRYMIKCKCVETYISQGVEFAIIQIKGQSFMLHQIRKMVGVAVCIVRNLLPIDIIEECFKPEKLEIPTAPSLGLVLNHVHYDTYNRRYGSDGVHESLEWDECNDEVMEFHKSFIARHIEDTEIQEKTMHLWLVDLIRYNLARKIEINRLSSEDETEDK